VVIPMRIGRVYLFVLLIAVGRLFRFLGPLGAEIVYRPVAEKQKGGMPSLEISTRQESHRVPLLLRRCSARHNRIVALVGTEASL